MPKNDDKNKKVEEGLVMKKKDKNYVKLKTEKKKQMEEFEKRETYKGLSQCRALLHILAFLTQAFLAWQ